MIGVEPMTTLLALEVSLSYTTTLKLNGGTIEEALFLSRALPTELHVARRRIGIEPMTPTRIL